MIMGLATDSSFSGHFACRAYIDTGLLNQNTRSDISTFVAKGRFPLFVSYEVSVPVRKIFLFMEIPLPKC